MNNLWDSKRSIMTKLEAFLYDPSVEWVQPKKPLAGNKFGLQESSSNEPVKTAEKTLQIIDRKLSGYIERENYSCEGQVEKLIQHATDKHNLSKMFMGWGAYL